MGSRAWSASAAAQLGLRYVVAGFINQYGARELINAYRDNFQPSDGRVGLKAPGAILAVHVVCADTEAEAQRQIAPVTVMYNNLSRGIIDAELPTPDKAVSQLGGLPKIERYKSGSGIPPKFVAGTAGQVHEQLVQMSKDFAVDEIIVQDMMTDHGARLRSYELLAAAFKLKN